MKQWYVTEFPPSTIQQSNNPIILIKKKYIGVYTRKPLTASGMARL